MIKTILVVALLFVFFSYIGFLLMLGQRHVKTYRSRKMAGEENPQFFRSDKEINILVILGILLLSLGIILSLF